MPTLTHDSHVPGVVPLLKLPTWMPDILTGDFQQYTFAKKGEIIAGGMADNDVAMALFLELTTTGTDTAEQAEIRKLLQTENGVEQLRLGNNLTAVSTATVAAAQALYQERRTHWLTRLERLSESNPPSAASSSGTRPWLYTDVWVVARRA